MFAFLLFAHAALSNEVAPSKFLCKEYGLLCKDKPTQDPMPKDYPEYSSQVIVVFQRPGSPDQAATGTLHQFVNSSFSSITVNVNGADFQIDTYEDKASGKKYTIRKSSGQDFGIVCSITAASSDEPVTSITYAGQSFASTYLSDFWVANTPSGASILAQSVYTNADTAYILNAGSENQTTLIFTAWEPVADERFKGVPASILPTCSEKDQSDMSDQHRMVREIAHKVHQAASCRRSCMRD